MMTRSAPRITLVGRGRAESLTSTCSAVRRKDQIGDEQWEVDSGVSAKRAPVLADEGVGTFVITKLPLAEMTMSTRALRAIQEDHVLAKAQSQDEELQCRVVKHELVAAKSEHSSSDAVSSEASTSNARKSTANNKVVNTLSCAHPHCQSTFAGVDDLISHLVNFHCQLQFRPRRLTFVSVEKYENWKSTHEKTNETTMVERGDREESEDVVRIQYHCEYCNAWRQQHEYQQSSGGGKCSQMTGCPSYLDVTICRQKGSVSLVGCLSHLGHNKRLLPASHRIPPSSEPAQRSTTSPTQCKYCRKWFAAQVTLNRHVREEHPEPNYMKGTTIECGDPHCDVVCDRMSTLCEHVAQEHGREDLVIEEFNFPSAERFKEWKDQVETDTMSKYVLSSSRMRNSGVLQSYYLCHLSGYANRSRHSVVSGNRFRSTKKLGRYCTAFINTRESPGGDVTVHCCLGHFGHSFDVRRLPLPRKVKDEVSELLMKGNDPQQVHEMVRKKYTASERGFYLKRYEVRNIADKLRKNGLISPKEKEASMSPTSSFHAEQQPGRSASPGKLPQQSVRFQSLRSLQDRGRFSRVTGVKHNEFNEQKVATQANDYGQGSRNIVSSHSAMQTLRDVSPPIIGPCGYEEYRDGDEYEEVDVMVGDVDEEGNAVTYFIEETHPSRNVLDAIHSVRSAPECAPSARATKVMPLLMEPQPTGNVGFDETMNSLRRRINALCAQLKQTTDAAKAIRLLAQVRDLQGQLVRGVPQTSAFEQPMEQDFDGEEEGEDVGGYARESGAEQS